MNIESKLPKGWGYKKFVEICLPKEGLKRGPFGSAIKKEYFVPDGNKVYEQSNAIYDDAHRGKYFIDDLKYKELINFNVIPGDILVSCSGTLGRILVIPSNAKKGVINQALLRIRIQENIISKKYFVYFFRSADFQRKILIQSQGTAMTNMIGMKDFKEIEIPLPDLKIQQEIVSKIEELFSDIDKGIEDLKIAQQQLKTYRQSVLKWAFEGKLTNENVKEGELPKGWKWTNVKDISSLLGDGLHGTPKYDASGEYYFINGNNLNDGKIEIKENTKKVSKEQFDKYKKQLNDKTIFVSINGSIGYTAFYNNEPVILGKSACYFNVKDEIDKHYIRYIFTSQRFTNYSSSVATGSTIKNVSLKSMREFGIPLPPTIKEQNQIVQEIESRLSVANKMEESINESLKQAEALRQSILKKAFSGNLLKETVQEKVYKSKNQYFFQMQIIGKVASISKKNKIEHGEMTIAKYAYLADKLFGIPTGFEFNRWHLGPYPPAIKKVVNNKQYFQRSGNHIEVVNESTLFKSTNDYTPLIDDAVSSLVSIFSKYKTPAERAHKTELLATICKVIEDIETTDLMLVRASMKEWKIDLKTSSFKNKAEKFSEDETKSCIGFIVSKGWDEKLI